MPASLLEILRSIVGAGVAVARIMRIMNSDAATGQFGLEWQLAQSNITAEAAVEAFTVSKMASAFQPVDPGAALHIRTRDDRLLLARRLRRCPS